MTDKSLYTAGNDMIVTVTLKDLNGNVVTDATDYLTTNTVTIQGTRLKTGSSWTDSSNGTYTSTVMAYSAKTNLKASLKLVDWSSAAQSADYEIRRGAFVAKNSSITIWVAGSSILNPRTDIHAGDMATVSIVLSDAYNNVCKDMSCMKDVTVTVPKMGPKEGSNWSMKDWPVPWRYYVPMKTGSWLNATMKFNDWEVSSGAYSVDLPTRAVADKSTIITDKVVYQQDDLMYFTITLLDEHGKPADLLDRNGDPADKDTWADIIKSSLKAPGVRLVDNWARKGPGIYAGGGYALIPTLHPEAGFVDKAKIKLPGWQDYSPNYAAYQIKYKSP
ncbi:hypothetical protein D3C73_1030100 [compost metagenome]